MNQSLPVAVLAAPNSAAPNLAAPNSVALNSASSFWVRCVQGLTHHVKQLCRRVSLFGVAGLASVAIGSRSPVQAAESLALSFDLPVTAAKVEPQAPPVGVEQASTRKQHPLNPIPEVWWHQGSASPIAIAIGCAEGTRQANGEKTAAYYWHADPGNGADNFGTFSYQHLPAALKYPVQRQTQTQAKREAAALAQLPEIADGEQLKRLRQFQSQLQAQAQQHNLALTQLELLNGLDLANQSEAAALSIQGYVDRLAQMKHLSLDPLEQIREARVWSYWHPDRQDWDAPGLGNTYEDIRRDQVRRLEAIQAAIASYKAQPETQTQPETVAQKTDVKQPAVKQPLTEEFRVSQRVSSHRSPEAIADQIIFF